MTSFGLWLMENKKVATNNRETVIFYREMKAD